MCIYIYPVCKRRIIRWCRKETDRQRERERERERENLREREES